MMASTVVRVGLLLWLLFCTCYHCTVGSMQRLASIEDVSGSEAEDVAQQLAMIDAISSDSERSDSVLPADRKRKRSTGACSKRDRLSNPTRIRTFLSEKKKCCSRDCMHKFQEQDLFGKLAAFRDEWVKMTKPDQDRVVPQHPLHCTYVFLHLSYSFESISS